MATTVKTGWLRDKNGDKFAPKTLTSQVQTSDGILLENKIQADIDAAKDYTDTKTENLASTSSVDTSISTHNTSTSAHSDIRALIDGLTTRLNTVANSDDTTLDQLSEIVAYIKSNKSLIDSITTNKINVSDIVDNLTTNNTSKVLSAAQGVAIKELIDDLQTAVDGKVPTSRTINGKALTSDVSLTASDVDAYSKTEIDSLELITTADIDTICGTTIQMINDSGVTF